MELRLGLLFISMLYIINFRSKWSLKKYGSNSVFIHKVDVFQLMSAKIAVKDDVFFPLEGKL